MPESVDRPAPERTTTSPSATRSASASSPPSGRASTKGSAVTPAILPSDRRLRRRAGGDEVGHSSRDRWGVPVATPRPPPAEVSTVRAYLGRSPRTGGQDPPPLLPRSAGGELRVQPLEDLLVDPAQALGCEGALEEAPDAAGAVPGGPDPDGGDPGVGGDHRPGGDHGGVRVGLDERVAGRLGDDHELIADALGRRREPPMHARPVPATASVHAVVAELLGEHPASGALVVGEG